jgi:hypothetical protein
MSGFIHNNVAQAVRMHPECALSSSFSVCFEIFGLVMCYGQRLRFSL